jgi:hypothetical protein
VLPGGGLKQGMRREGEAGHCRPWLCASRSMSLAEVLILDLVMTERARAPLDEPIVDAWHIEYVPAVWWASNLLPDLVVLQSKKRRQKFRTIND